MPNLVVTTPVPFDAIKLPYTFGYSFGGGGVFMTWTNSGPYEANGKLWCVNMNGVPEGGVNAAIFLSIYSSMNNGSTWTEEDSVGAPQLSVNGVPTGVNCDVVFGHDNKFYILVRPQNAGLFISIQTFDTSTGLWGASIVGPLATSVPLGGLATQISIFQNSTNTDLIVFLDRVIVTNHTLKWVRVVGGVFGAEQTLRASGLLNGLGPGIVVDSSDIAHVFFSDGGVSTYQAINTDDSLGIATPTGVISSALGKAVIWQNVIAFPGVRVVAGRSQPFVTLASPASSPVVFAASQVFDEPLDPTSINTNSNGMRLMVDGGGSLWIAWMAFSHVPGSPGDPVTVSQIELAELCTPLSGWGNHQIFWDQLTDPQLDQPLNDPSAISFANFSISYLSLSGTFKGVVNISGFTQTYAYFLRSVVTAISITVCSIAPIGESMNFRLQVFDDGAGEYIFDQPLNSLIASGSESNATALTGNAIGPFILPSPLAICKPGLMTISISNVNAPLNTGNDVANNVIAYVGFVFAIPKKCKNICYGGVQGQIERGLERRGVIS